MHVFGRYASSMLLFAAFFFFFSSQIAVILSRLYDMSRVLVARRETMQVTLCEGRPGKDRYDSLGSWQKHVPGLFL